MRGPFSEIRRIISNGGNGPFETNQIDSRTAAFTIKPIFSVLGAAIAYFTLKWQERIQIEKGKVNTANKWILLAEEARSNLLAIKGNYNGKLDENPFKRAAIIPTILLYDDPISTAYHELSFIVPKEKDSSTDGVYPKWSQITTIRCMIGNYNYALSMWKHRNILNEEFKQKLADTHGHTILVQGFSTKHALDAVGQPFLIKFIDLTEVLVRVTDDLVVEIDDFLENFPKYAKTKILKTRLDNYGSVYTYSNNDNKALLGMLKKSPEVDFSGLESMFGERNEDIKKRHQTGY